MPIYEFQCKGCQSIFEALLSRPTSYEDVRCPKCGSPDIVRVLSSFSCQTLKGGSTAGNSSCESSSSRFS